MNQSYQLSDYYGRYTLTHQVWTIEEELKELPGMYIILVTIMSTDLSWWIGVKLEDVETHMKQLLEKVNIQMLVAGNMYKDVSGSSEPLDPRLTPVMQQAIALSKSVEQILGSSSLKEVPSNRALILPEGVKVQRESF